MDYEMMKGSGADEEQHPAESESGMLDVASNRVAQEVQAAMVIAKKFPRDEGAAYSRIMKSCKRPALAEAATYVYERGNTQIKGLSIRLAEVLAQNWGNVDFGIVELDQKAGESTMMAYAWDLETNTRQTKIFHVKHKRDTKKGSYQLTDSRDIYEMTANQGARRLRACILGIIPGDIQDDALRACEKTLASGHTEPLSDRIRKMVAAFDGMGVSSEMIEQRLGHKIEITSEQELVNLRNIYTSIKDHMAPVDQYFEVAEASDVSAKSKAVKDKLKGKGKGKSKSKGDDNAPSVKEDVKTDDDTTPNPCGSWPSLSALIDAEPECVAKAILKAKDGGHVSISGIGELNPEDAGMIATVLACVDLEADKEAK